LVDMHARAWVAIAAMIGVLFHASVVVRHATMVLSGVAQHFALLADLGVICRSAGGSTALLPSDTPELPAPPPYDDCPVCSGLAQVNVVLPTALPEIDAPLAGRAKSAVATEKNVLNPIPVCPPSTGPPVVA